MRAVSTIPLVLGALLLSGCFLDRAGLGAGRDAGPRDGGTWLDGGGLDGGGLDAGPRPDAAVLDASRPDATTPPEDAGPFDAGDPCRTGPDADGDGVSDACDICPGSDDGVDSDGDGTPDGCDDWPCGLRPTVPSTVSAELIRIGNVRLGSGSGLGNTVVATRSSSLRLRLDYAIDDTSCGGCIDQVEIGTSPGNRLFCAYDGNPPGSGGASGSVDQTISVPGSTGLVELRFNLGQNFSCNEGGASTWWDAAPGSDQTFGVICVTP